jgi:hypothetical protein
VKATTGVLAALLGALLIAAQADASHLTVNDPNDAKGLLDIRLVESGGQQTVTFRVETRARRTTRSLFERGFVLIQFDTRFGDGPDYFAVLRSNGRRMVGTLFRDYEKQRDRAISGLTAWRRSRSSFSVTVPLMSMAFGRDREEYRWRAQTLFSGPNCRRVCFDFAPNKSWVLEPVPEA